MRLQVIDEDWTECVLKRMPWVKKVLEPGPGALNVCRELVRTLLSLLGRRDHLQHVQKESQVMVTSGQPERTMTKLAGRELVEFLKFVAHEQELPAIRCRAWVLKRDCPLGDPYVVVLA